MKTFGRYALEELIGQGPVASVYRAVSAGDTVALKVLHPQLAADEVIRERFKREALEARALRHPGIVQVYDLAVEEQGVAVVGEYCPGGNLEGWKAAGPGELEDFALQAAAALDFAHSLGAVHRNLKPTNVLRGADGSFKLSDFGSALIQDLVGLTATTAFLGAPQFVAPESLDRPYPDPRWDLYSLGACLYLAATGKPHADRSMASLFSPARGFERPSSIEPSIPAYLDQIILSLLGPVAYRPRTAAELISLLKGRGDARRRSKECLFCGARMAQASSVCPACLKAEPDLSPLDSPEAQAVVITKASEDAQALKEIGRIMKIVSGDPERSVRFITEDARLYSLAERERYAAMPCRLIDSIAPESASLLVSLIAARTEGKVLSQAMPMKQALRKTRFSSRRRGTRRPGQAALISADPRFAPSEGPGLEQRTGFERSALLGLGGDAPLPGPSGASAIAGPEATASDRRREGADLVLAARACLARALSLDADAEEFKKGLMGIVMKASALMDSLAAARARLDAVSLAGLYAAMKRLEEEAASTRDADLADERIKEKARILDAYQEFKELERDACLMNNRLLRAAAALDALAVRAGPDAFTASAIAPIAELLES